MSIHSPALFASAFHPHVGGVEELTRQLALEQQRRAMTPLVVTMRWPKDLPAVDTVDGVPVLRHVFRVPEPTPRHLGGWLLHSGPTQRVIAEQLRDRTTDVVHVQCVSNNARYARAAARRLDVPLVVTMQGELTMDATGIYQRSAEQRRAWRRLLDAADAVTGCSAEVIDVAAGTYPGPWQRRASVVPNGIRLADFQGAEPWPHRRPYLLGIGRLVPQKGFDLLIEAAGQVSAEHDVDLLLAGDGSERGRLEALVDSLGMRDRVTFLGSVDRPTAVRLFTGAAAFVLPSRYEPQGIVILEAMAAGAPVVAARVGGVPETVVDGHNGLLFTGGDADDLSRALSDVLGDADVAHRLRSAGYETAERRDWSRVTDQYDEVYRSVDR